MGGGIDPDARVGDLPAAERSLVAIARALAVESDAAGARRADGGAARAGRRAPARGAAAPAARAASALLYVTHRLDEVFRIADRVTVLRDGRHVAVRARSPRPRQTLWSSSIVGRSLTELFRQPPAARPETVLAVDGLGADGAGPVLVLCAPARSSAWSACAAPATTSSAAPLRRDADPCRRDRGGRQTFRRDSAGERRGARASASSPAGARGEPRPEPHGPGEPVHEPAPLASAVSRLVGTAAERAPRPTASTGRYGVRPPDPERRSPPSPAAISRRWCVARWMEATARLLVLEEPTFGVDVGSKAEIYQLLQQALGDGPSVLLISSDFEEVAGICHRALVFNRGAVSAESPRGELVVARLTALASGAPTRPQECGMSGAPPARAARAAWSPVHLGLGPADPARPPGHRLLAARSPTPSSPPSTSSRWSTAARSTRWWRSPS